MTILQLVRELCFIKNGKYTQNFCKSIGVKLDDESIYKVLDLENAAICGINRNPITLKSNNVIIDGNLSCNSINIGSNNILSSYENKLCIVDSSTNEKIELNVNDEMGNQNKLITKEDIAYINSNLENDSNFIKTIAEFLKFIPEIGNDETAVTELNKIIRQYTTIDE